MRILVKLAGLVMTVVIGLTFAAGCSALRKPAPQNPPAAQAPQTGTPSGQQMPTDPGEVGRIASNLSSAAARVSGVNRATVVIAGTTAYVGIDQKAGLEKGQTERIKEEVSSEVKKAEPRLTAVFVSSDPDVVTRLRRIADGVASGQPVSAFDSELAEIAKRISPTAK
ncbi:MAG TPA: YhcN/YlaJ family sporulation lipoprotein [Bacillota bacterium]|nr:YhcN/YlaJ family sporulation lipoprotein [Bacillota bacterium]